MLTRKIRNFVLEYNITPVFLTGVMLFVLFIIVFWSSVIDLLSLWNEEGTYSHGFIIPFLSLYLLFQKKTDISNVSLKPAPILLIPLSFILFLWLFASISETQIIELSLLPLIFIIACVSITGYRAALIIAMPLLYLFFATPAWDILIPALQKMAVLSNELALTLSGIPTYIENTVVTIPAGKFEIAGGCSGISFLVATLSLTTFYALNQFNSFKPIIIVFLISIIFAIVLNWIRIYMIILIGHFTDMQSSIVNDHDNFGWTLYAISLIPLYFIAKRLTPAEAIEESNTNKPSSRNDNKSYPKIFILPPILLIIGMTYISNHIQNKETSTLDGIPPPLAQSPWAGPIYFNQWTPSYRGASIESDLLYIGTGNIPDVSLHIYYYGKQSRDIELISISNSIADDDLIKSQKNIKLGQHDITETIIQNEDNKERLIWHWFNVNNTNTIKPLWAKLLQAQELINGKISSSLISLSIECNTQCDNEKIPLEIFLNKHYDKIFESLTQ